MFQTTPLDMEECMAYYKKSAQNGYWHGGRHLYQKNPRLKNPDATEQQPERASWTSSIESFRKAARCESFCLFSNGLRANRVLQLNLLRNYFIADIDALCKEQNDLRGFIRRHNKKKEKEKIVAHSVMEVTRNKFKTAPTDQVHFHFLIHTTLSETELIDLFHRACQAAKYASSDYRISKVCNIAGTSDEEYKRICAYQAKDGYEDRIIMFKPGLGFNKIRKIGDFWVNKNGVPTTKQKIWLQAEWRMKPEYPLRDNVSLSPQTDPSSATANEGRQSNKPLIWSCTDPRFT